MKEHVAVGAQPAKLQATLVIDQLQRFASSRVRLCVLIWPLVRQEAQLQLLLSPSDLKGLSEDEGPLSHVRAPDV